MPRPISHSARSGGRSPPDPQGPPLSTRMVAGRPQWAKARRSSARTPAGGTFSHLPWGKTRRPQHGAAALGHDPQPTDALPGPEPAEIIGIDSPDAVV